MENRGDHRGTPSRHGLENQGFGGVASVHRNLTRKELVELAVARGEAVLSEHDAVITRTGKHTGRSPNDKFLVREPSSEADVWWGNVNRDFDPAKFDALHTRVAEFLQGKEVFVRDCYAGADPAYRFPVRIITEYAWHNLFATNLFIQPEPGKTAELEPQFTVVSIPSFKADPDRDGTRSPTFILLNFAKRLVLIGGTEYAGEIKKSVFTVLNYLLPLKGVLSMHCSANVGEQGDTALFFGLSGTGKTTLSTDPERPMIGDDEHGWADDGVFNFEGGCYAKVIKLSPEGEPEIYACTRKFGTVLENVVYDEATRKLDLDDDTITENTRAAYPLTHLDNIEPSSRGGHPKNIFMLTADAFGVLPPIAKLTADQAAYHFLAGYTAKVAGTERGVTEPEATFSACFGAPFMVHKPGVYAKMLAEKIAKHDARCWLVNTGWTGGPYGVGTRMKLAHTRATIHAALNGDLDGVEFVTDPVFGVEVPTSCPGVPGEVLRPEETWADKAAYRSKAQELAEKFAKNSGQFADDTPEAVRNAGPKVAVSK